MFFAGSLNIPDGTFHVPGVIYKVSGDRLDIFSYKGEKPAENSPLFLAPFFNVTGSSVCLGNAALTPPEDMTFSKLLEYWENVSGSASSPIWEETGIRLKATWSR